MKLDKLIEKLKVRHIKLKELKGPERYYRLPNESTDFENACHLSGQISEIARVIEQLEMAKELGTED